MAATTLRLRAGPSARLADVAGGLAEPALRVWSAAVYVFLFIPIAMVVVFSFNGSRLVEIWTGFSLRWYGTAWTDPSILAALRVSLTVAASTRCSRPPSGRSPPSACNGSGAGPGLRSS